MATALRRNGTLHAESIVIVMGGHEVEVRPGGSRVPQERVVPEPAVRPKAPEHWRYFSPLEEALIKAAREDEWVSAESLANAVGEKFGPEFRGVMKNLVEREVFDSLPGCGYRLKMTKG